MATKRRSRRTHHQTVLHSLLTAARDALHRDDFASYVGHLDRLGIFLIARHKENHLEEYITHKIELHNRFSYCVFEEAWKDDYLKNPVSVNGTERDRRYLSPKASLNRSTRHQINLGMRAFALSFKSRETLSKPSDHKIAKLDKKACEAISNYLNPRQKILHRSGVGIAVLTSIVCSIVTAGAVALTVAAWPLALAGVLTAAVFVATSIINWVSFRSVVPRFLHEVFGKDKLFEGITEYRDPDTGEKKQLSRARKITLGIIALVSTLISIATGAVTYGFVTGLSKLALFSFAAGTVGTALLPPVGIAIALVFCIASFITLMKPLINMIKSKDIKSLLKRPFEEIAAIFSPSHKKNKGKSLLQLKIEKAIAFTILGILSGFSLFGLVVLQVQSGAALARFLNTTMAISSAIAVGISQAFSMTFVFIGKLPYALKALSNILVGVVSSVRHLFQKPSSYQSLKDEAPPSTKTVVVHQVHNAILETIYAISPDHRIKKQAKSARIETLKTANATSTLDRPRYWQQYLFTQPRADTPSSLPVETMGYTS